jgi:hypothetical protein
VLIDAEGTPATVVITEPFQGLVASGAAKLGVPGYPSVVVPHPVWGKGPDELQEIAAGIADRVLALLTTP